MPHDLGTLLRVGSAGSNGGGGDGRVTCETLLHLSDGDTTLPSESILLSKQDELDWFDRNVFYERKESTKGNSNPSRVARSNSNPNSQRLATKSKPSIIGLPKPQPATFPDSKHRRNVKTSKIRFFPKRLGSASKFSLKHEPSSPKVSCMGRVRSRDRSWSMKKRKKPSSSTTTDPSSEKTGFWASLKNFFSFRKKKPTDGDVSLEKKVAASGEKKTSLEFEEEGSGVNPNPNPNPNLNPNPNPPGLGGLNRFVSGRRSDCWAGDVVVDVDLQKDERHSSC